MTYQYVGFRIAGVPAVLAWLARPLTGFVGIAVRDGFFPTASDYPKASG